MTYNYTYYQLGYRSNPVCFVCKQDVTSKQAFMVCENLKHCCHKTCLKKQVQENWEDKLNSGHGNYSGGKSYKKHKCSCGKSMEVFNTFGWKVKKALKYASPLLLIVFI